MEITNIEKIDLEDGRVKVNFKATGGKYEFSDALHFESQIEYDSYDTAAIDAMMVARFNNWIAVITAVYEEETVPTDVVV